MAVVAAVLLAVSDLDLSECVLDLDPSERVLNLTALNCVTDFQFLMSLILELPPLPDSLLLWPGCPPSEPHATVDNGASQPAHDISSRFEQQSNDDVSSLSQLSPDQHPAWKNQPVQPGDVPRPVSSQMTLSIQGTLKQPFP